jgi:hypothetical protein
LRYWMIQTQSLSETNHCFAPCNNIRTQNLPASERAFTNLQIGKLI